MLDNKEKIHPKVIDLVMRLSTVRVPITSSFNRTITKEWSEGNYVEAILYVKDYLEPYFLKDQDNFGLVNSVWAELEAKHRNKYAEIPIRDILTLIHYELLYPLETRDKEWFEIWISLYPKYAYELFHLSIFPQLKDNENINGYIDLYCSELLPKLLSNNNEIDIKRTLLEAEIIILDQKVDIGFPIKSIINQLIKFGYYNEAYEICMRHDFPQKWEVLLDIATQTDDQEKMLDSISHSTAYTNKSNELLPILEAKMSRHLNYLIDYIKQNSLIQHSLLSEIVDKCYWTIYTPKFLFNTIKTILNIKKTLITEASLSRHDNLVREIKGYLPYINQFSEVIKIRLRHIEEESALYKHFGFRESIWGYINSQNPLTEVNKLVEEILLELNSKEFKNLETVFHQALLYYDPNLDIKRIQSKIEILKQRVDESSKSESKLDTILELLLKTVDENGKLDKILKITSNTYSTVLDTNETMKETNNRINEVLKSMIDIQSDIKNLKSDFSYKLDDLINNGNKNELELESIYNDHSDRIMKLIEKEFLKFRAADSSNEERKLSIKFGTAWGKLDLDTKKYLITSRVLYKNSFGYDGEIDYSPVCIPLTKALERVLFFSLFRNFKDQLNSDKIDKKNWPIGLVNVKKDKDKDKDKVRFTEKSDRHYSLGSIGFILEEERHKGDIHPLALKYCKDVLFNPVLFEDTKAIESYLKSLIKDVDDITNQYRNKAAHKDNITLEEANKCYDKIVKIEETMKKFLEKLK
ncbi:hypothetical protein [Ammoniphilus sp. CFH 90114]|uniref:hypothetical protein n=1 Tax=Ammoniphilus sp. CFH 90114 TaxID=2493665 RepID=UPI00100E8737|nr:hypothetical protein [Ammoniphilus sp. CFH 90114]RXT14885.1 hypothetical protein EIZ39_01345 [Ammoniphilus sp. CFH 90114]